jgi:hypothetical protein
MGWYGYCIYCGDDTQTRHYDFFKWGKIASDYEITENDWLTNKGTIIPKIYIDKFIKNIPLILKKMPKVKFWNEDNAIEWQMLLALFIDNNIKPPKEILSNGITATEYLMEEHAADFNNPSLRRKHLKNFIKKAKNLA